MFKNWKHSIGLVRMTAAFGAVTGATVAVSLTNIPLPVAYCQSQHLYPSHPYSPSYRKLGYRAVNEFVTPGMVVGIGHGPAPYFAVERLAQLTDSGKLTDIVVVPTSELIAKHALAKGLTVRALSSQPVVHLMISDALEVDVNLNLLQAQEGALMQERLMANTADQRVYAVDESQLVAALGPGHPLSVEISPASYEHIRGVLESLPVLQDQECKIVLRRGGAGQPYPDGNNIAVTDAGNYIIDIFFKSPIESVEKLRWELDSCTGVVTHSVVGSSKVESVMYDNGVRVKPEIDAFHPLAATGDDFVVLVSSSEGVRAIRRPMGAAIEESISRAEEWESDDDLTSLPRSLQSASPSSAAATAPGTPVSRQAPTPTPTPALPAPQNPLPLHLDFDTIQNRGIN